MGLNGGNLGVAQLHAVKRHVALDALKPMHASYYPLILDHLLLFSELCIALIDGVVS